MKSWYYSKEPQERRIILILAVVIGLSLFYLLIWSPITEGFAQKTTQVEAQKKLLSWMKNSSLEIKRLQGSSQGKSSKSNAPLLSTVDSTIKSSGLGRGMKRLEPQGNNKVQIWFENTGFDSLVSWLGKLASQYQIHIYSINIDRQDTPGTVNARLVLTKGI